MVICASSCVVAPRISRRPSEVHKFTTSEGVDMQPRNKTEKPLEIVFRPGQAVGIVYLRNPRQSALQLDITDALEPIKSRRVRSGLLSGFAATEKIS
jgi:hypothetical protein